VKRFVLTVITAAAVAFVGTAVTASDPVQAGSRECSAKRVQPASVARRVVVRSILCLLNKKRTERGMGRLKPDSEQRRAASRHNRLMVRSKCFAHRCPGEGDLVTRLTRASYLPCSCAWGVGENIAWGTGSRATPKATVRAWMRSPGHRRNILNPEYRHIGVAVHEGVPISGLGGGATYTTDFGYQR
jgi:uncharacterized protein YkwD